MTTTPARRGARIATLVAGGLVAALALAATTTGALVALGAADTSQQGLVLPDGVTALEVRTTALQVGVYSDVGRSGEPATAFLNGTASTAFGPLPRLELEVVGSTAILTVDESRRHLAPTPYAIEIQLGGLALESIDVESVERPVHIDASAERIRAVSYQSWAQVRVDEPGVLEHLEVLSLEAAYLMLPEAGGPYDVLLPEWFDESVIRDWWAAHYGLDYPSEVALADDPRLGEGEPRASDGPGVFVPTAPGAPTTVDLRDANGMIQVVGIESLEHRP